MESRNNTILINSYKGSRKDTNMRKPMVTRTINGTQVKALCLDVKTAQPVTNTYTLSGTFKDESKLLKKLQKLYDTDDLKVVHISETQEINTLYGMDEDYFLAHASILDPETRKPLAEVADAQ